MTLYSDAEHPIAAETQALHESELLSFARPGTWGTAKQRTAIAAHARSARCEAGVQESVGDEALADSDSLPDAAIRLARSVALGGVGIDQDYCDQTQIEGVTEGAYVEIVGLVARLAHLDVFARGIGLPSRKLADPVDDQAPSQQRPATATKEGFFTASVPNPPEGGDVARSLFGDHPVPNILRSLSLVPSEAERLINVLNEEYFSMDTMMDLSYSSHDALTRPQLELVAARVSALNQCFY
jgi:hypothetical protein